MSLSLDKTEREGQLAKVIDSISSITQSAEWSSLKTYVLDDVVSTLERRLLAESQRMPLNEPEIYKLQGQLLWAKRYADLQKLATEYLTELKNIRKLNPPTERDTAPE